MTSIWLLGGLNLSAIGIGIYLQKVYIQTKNRPRIIRHIHQRNLKTDL